VQSTSPQLARVSEARVASGMNSTYRSELAQVSSPATTNSVAAHYERKTQAILQRYGPGPRVHYHTGFVEDPKPPASIARLRAQLVESQERMLRYASDLWQLRRAEFRDLLDVGCGLGGSAIFWAQEFGARVTAITIAPSHVEIVARFARQAGVESRVIPLLCEASSVPGEACFDAAIAIESSCLFPRRPWFRSLARLLRPFGRVFISDCFLRRSAYEYPFNHHWCAQIGTIEEYLDVAQECGFTLRTFEDVSIQAATFWATTLALIRTEGRDSNPDSAHLRNIDESLRTHAIMREGLVEGGFCHGLLSFVRQ
jgi:tocopherol O-methyltransferase